MISHPSQRGKPQALARATELRVRCLVLVRRSILTLAAVPDHEARFQRRPGSGLPSPIYTAQEVQQQIDHAAKLAAATGETGRRSRRFQPTPRDLDRYLEVLSWLAWLSTSPGGDRDVKLLVAHAHRVPWWMLCQRFGRSAESLRRYHHGAIAVLAARYGRDIDRLWAKER